MLIWVVTAAGAGVFHRQILDTVHISSPALLVTVTLALVTMWKPVFYGVLQGSQNFLWMGWAAILAGVGRLSAGAVIVNLFGGRAGGNMTRTLGGENGALGLGNWRSQENWARPHHRVEWQAWL